MALDNQRCVAVGCDNGRVYAVKSDGTPIAGWPATGILLDGNPRYPGISWVQSSPVVGDVMNTSTQQLPDQQIVVGTTLGDVYVIWSDGNNHANGPVAKVWTCAEAEKGLETSRAM